jgi:hypothetical protein
MLSHTIVAVKVATSPEDRSLLEEEAAVLSRLQHSNVQRALGWVELPNDASGHLALVFEDSAHGNLGVAMTGMCDFQRCCKLTLLRALSRFCLDVTSVTLADCTLRLLAACLEYEIVFAIDVIHLILHTQP